jgi:S-adenosylmethionine:diacylglycerol 3-amino-3-carboxypropyl transferase
MNTTPAKVTNVYGPPQKAAIHAARLTEIEHVGHPQFTPLEQERRSAVTTAEAAFHLNRKPQTLLIWSCKELGPIRPIKVCGRLMWRTDDLRTLVGASHRTTETTAAVHQ